MTIRNSNHEDLHVRGYMEKSSIPTSFDLVGGFAAQVPVIPADGVDAEAAGLAPDCRY